MAQTGSTFAQLPPESSAFRYAPVEDMLETFVNTLQKLSLIETKQDVWPYESWKNDILTMELLEDTPYTHKTNKQTNNYPLTPFLSQPLGLANSLFQDSMEPLHLFQIHHF